MINLGDCSCITSTVGAPKVDNGTDKLFEYEANNRRGEKEIENVRRHR